VTVHRISCSVSVAGVWSISEQVALYLCLVTAPEQDVIQQNTRTTAQLALKDPDFILSDATGQEGEIPFRYPDWLFSFH